MKFRNAVTPILRGGIFLAAAFIYLPLLSNAADISVLDWGISVDITLGQFQSPIYDLACPAGTSPIQSLQTTVPLTGHLRANWCVDANGNVIQNVGGTSPTGNISGFIQAVTTSSSGLSVNLPAMNVTAGDLLFCAGSGSSGSGPIFVTDTFGNTFTSAAGGLAWYVGTNSSGSDIITLTFLSSQTAFFSCGEYSGVAFPVVLDQISFAFANNGTFATTTNATVTTAANELIIVFAETSGGGATFSEQPPFTLRIPAAGITSNSALADAFQVNINPIAGYILASSGPNRMGVLTFKGLPRSVPAIYTTNPNLQNGPCSGPNCFFLPPAVGFGGPGDTVEILDATWSSNSTSGSSAGAAKFHPGMNNMRCWGTPQAMQPQAASSGTFTFVSPTSWTCGPAGTMIGAPSGNGLFTAGHDDTNTFTPIISNLFQQPKCGSLYLGAARYMVHQGLSYLGTIAPDCGVNIFGAGYASTIEAMPEFNPSTSTNNVGCNTLGCWFNTSASTAFLYFTISGEYNSESGVAGFPASLFTVGAGSYSYGVNLFNFATATPANSKGVNINGTGPFFQSSSTQNWGDGNIWCTGNACATQNAGSSTTTLKNNANLSDLFGTFGGQYTTGAGAITHLNQTKTFANNGGFGSASVDHQGGELVYMTDAEIGGLGSVGLNGIGFQFNANGSGASATLHACHTKFVGGSSGAAISVASGVTGDLFDDCNSNTYTSPFLSNAGTFRYHHRETGTCVFAAGTTCTVTFGFTFGNSTLPTFLISPINPGAITFTVTALSTTQATITASGANSLSVGWEAVLQ